MHNKVFGPDFPPFDAYAYKILYNLDFLIKSDWYTYMIIYINELNGFEKHLN